MEIGFSWLGLALGLSFILVFLNNINTSNLIHISKKISIFLFITVYILGEFFVPLHLYDHVMLIFPMALMFVFSINESLLHIILLIVAARPHRLTFIFLNNSVESLITIVLFFYPDSHYHVI